MALGKAEFNLLKPLCVAINDAHSQTYVLSRLSNGYEHKQYLERIF